MPDDDFPIAGRALDEFLRVDWSVHAASASIYVPRRSKGDGAVPGQPLSATSNNRGTGVAATHAEGQFETVMHSLSQANCQASMKPHGKSNVVTCVKRSRSLRWQ